MRWMVTGTSGHLGEALVRMLRAEGHETIGLDLLPGQFTDIRASITNPEVVAEAMTGVTHVLHTATLHKPHIGTHSRQAFVETNVTGTLVLLEAAARAGIRAFVFTSTTSTFGNALVPGAGAPAAWITEDVAPQPKNIYGATKLAAEALAEAAARRDGLPVVILRTSRFFPEEDDRRKMRESYSDANLKVNEFLNRRVDLEDAARAHLLAADRAPDLGFARFLVSAPSPFLPEDTLVLRTDPETVVENRVSGFRAIYRDLGWRMFDDIARVYDSSAAVTALGWRPTYDFSHVLTQLRAGETFGSALASTVGIKGYHDETFTDGPYPVES